MKQKAKRLISILLTLVLVLSLMPCMSLTVYADTTKAYAAYDVTTDDNKDKSGDALTALQVTFNGKKWYIIEDNSTAVNAGTVTLLTAERFGTLAFDSTAPYSNSYNSSTVKEYLEGLTNAGGSFAGVAKAIKPVTLTTYTYNSTVVAETTENAKLYLLSVTEAQKVPMNVRGFSDSWWLRSQGNSDSKAACVYAGGIIYLANEVNDSFGVRPALKLDLSAVTFSSNTFTVKPYAAYNVTTYANKNKSGDALTALQVTFNGKKWYIIEDNSTAVNAGTVTLLAAESFGTSKFDDSSNAYSTSTIKGTLEEMTASGGSFASVKDAIVDTNLSDVGVDGAKLYLLNYADLTNLNVPTDVRKFSTNWWLRSPGNSGCAAYFGTDGTTMHGSGDPVSNTYGVRPALKLDLSAVHFSSASKEFTLNPYASLVNTTTPVKFNGIDWYIIADNSTAVNAGTVTLLAADESFGTSAFNSSNSNAYNNSTVERLLYALTEGGDFASVKDAIADTDLSDVGVYGAKLYLLSEGEANNLPTNVRIFHSWWWLRSPSYQADHAVIVTSYGGVGGSGGISYSNAVRPALNLNLSAVHFSSASKEFTLNPYASLVNTTTPVKFNGIDWYIIDDNSTAVNAGTVTLLAKDPLIASKFHDSSNAYSISTVKDYLEGLTTGSGSFSSVANAIETIKVKGSDADSEVDAKLWLLSTTEANEIKNANSAVLKCSKASGIKNNVWWLRSPGNDNSDNVLRAAFVYGDYDYGIVSADGINVAAKAGVRPALNLDLSEVTFTSVTLSGGANATPSVDNTTQYFFNVGTTPNNMTVTYTASNGYQFPESSDYYKKTNGITVARTNATTVTVSGTPTDNASITVPDAVLPATAPTVTTQPGDTTLTSGYTTGTTLSVEATAATDTTYDALTYQWYSNTSAVNTGGTSIDNATGASYTFPTGKSEGNYYYYCVVTATRTDNSATATTTSSVATVTVNAATPPTPPKPNPPSPTPPSPSKPTAYVKTAPVVNTLTYSEQPQKLVTAGESTGGEMLYALGNSKSSMPTSGWSTSIPTGTDAGTYFVWYKAKGDSYHRDSYPKCVTVTIGKGSSTITTPPTVETLINNGEPQELVTAGEADGGTMQYAVGTDPTTAPEDGWSTEIPKVTDAGTYYIWYKVVGDNDHEDSEPSYAGAATIIENHSDNELAIDEEKGIATVKDDVSGGTTEVPLYIITEGLTYRMYDPNRGEHFYTKNPDEVESLVQFGWRHESDSDFTVVSATEEDAAPVYRLYNPNCGGMHFYTTDAEEAKYLKSIGWNYEGISHYVYKATSTKGTPQHRLYNPNSPSAEHLWTSDEAEVNMLIEVGWVYEGICWRIV